ncbi:SPOR domain-containing protein [Halioxenophilus sp. WMMB6]|uniref:SPOR domain-containing protein n=1 Tax=Halioxenophilus sp. WMMB6 TaxID=3073815 RepID=UPI00295E21D3|nr:SPOR domain-containing protein [Halioxenophilus sp. WMMB6]
MRELNGIDMKRRFHSCGNNGWLGNGSLGGWLTSALGLLLLLVLNTPALAQDRIFGDDQLLILDLHYKRYGLMEGMEAYKADGHIYFALVDMVATLQMPIEVQGLEAKGRLDKARSFQLSWDGSRWQVEREGKTLSVGAKDIVYHDETLFVSNGALEQWFPIELDIDLADAQVDLVVDGSLPFLESISRRDRIFSRSDAISEYEFPIYDSPYSVWEVPSVDFRITHTTTRNNKTDSDTSRLTRYTLVSNGDMALMSSNIFVNGTREEGIDNASIRFDRFDSERDLFGPLHLSQFSFGDISAPGAKSSYGRGVLISNESNTSQLIRDFTTIEGNYYPGWEVELYLGETIVDFQVIGDDGRYRFTDVVLGQGINDYRLVFYGPAGEREVENRNLYVGEDTDDVNRLRYTLSVVQPDTRLYSANDNSTSGWQANLVTRYSLGNLLALNAAYSQRRWDDSELSDAQLLSGYNTTDYYTVGATSFLLGQSLSVTLQQQDSDPYDVTYSLGGGKRRLRYRFSYTDYGLTEADLLADQTESLLKGTVTTQFKKFSVLFDGRQYKHADYDLNFAEINFGGQYKKFYWSNGYEYRQDYLNGAVEDQLFTELYTGTRVGPLATRVNAIYAIQPESELSNLGFSADLRLSRSVDVSFDYGYQVQEEINSYSLGMNWRLPYVTVNPYIRYNDNGLVQGNLSVLLSMGARDGELGNYYSLSRQTISSQGTLNARLFEDENGDGVYNTGERLLSGGVIHSLQTRQKAESDDVGIATITNIRAWFPSDIVYESDSVEDYSMKYGGRDFSIEMRPGKVMEVDLPFYRAGDIDGVVYRARYDGSSRRARGITLDLTNAAGDVVATTVSASDGYYSFQRVLPGSYRVITRGQKMKSPLNRDAVITRAGNFIGDYNLVIDDSDPTLGATHNSLEFLDPSAGPISSVTNPSAVQPVVHPLVAVAPPAAVPAASAVPLTSPAATPAAAAPLTTASLISAPVATSPVRAAPVTTAPVRSIGVPTAAAPESVAPTVVAPPADPWALQLGSFSVASYAEALTDKLRSQSTPYYVREVSNARGKFIRVFAGPFDGRTAALERKAALDRDLKVQSFLVASP